MTKKVKFSKLSLKAKAEIAGALIEENKFEEASSILEPLNVKFPKNLSVKFYLGVLAYFKNDMKSAEFYFKHALEIDSSHAESYINLSSVYDKTFRILESIKSLKSALAYSEENGEVYNKAKKKYDLISEKILSEHKISIDKYLESGDIFNLAFEKINEEKFEEAIELFNKVLVIDKNHVQSYGNLGFCFMKLHKFEEAKKYFEKALEIDPRYATARQNLDILNKGLNESEN